MRRYPDSPLELDTQMKDDFSVTFPELADKVPIYSQHLSSEKAEAGKQFEITDWNGKNTASQGALKPRDGAERYKCCIFLLYGAFSLAGG